MKRIYVASSWRNLIQREIVQVLREAGHEVYDFRNPAPGNKGFAWSEVNPACLQWSPEQFITDLYSGHAAVEQGFRFDKNGLDWADVCVLVLPCGRSAHLEAGYAAGRGKRTLFYLHPDRFEPELMYLLGDGCVTNASDLLRAIEGQGVRKNDRRDTPLSLDVDASGALTISIGIERLASCFEMTSENNPFDDASNEFKKLYRVTDKQEFADEVRHALCDEREDGSTILTDLFDKACWNAIEDGCLGVFKIDSNE